MPTRIKGKIVTQADAAAIFGVMRATVRDWERAGCPVETSGGNGRASRYNTAEMHRWLRDRAVLAATGDAASMDADDHRRRKLAAEAEMAEIELNLKRGDYLPKVPLLAHIAEMFAGYRRELQAMPARRGAQMAAEIGCDVLQLDRALTKAIREHLTELSAPVTRT